MENVKDLLDEACRFISFDVFVRKFKVKTNYLEYYKVASTLTRHKKLCSPINGNDQTQNATKTLLSHTKFCKKVYQRLIGKKACFGEATENLVHLFWSCKYSNAFWKDCYQWIMQNTSKVENSNIQKLSYLA